MLNRLSAREREHLAMVKALPCSVCDAPAPSEAHHIEQGLQFVAVALCPDCHRGPLIWAGMASAGPGRCERWMSWMLWTRRS